MKKIVALTSFMVLTSLVYAFEYTKKSSTINDVVEEVQIKETKDNLPTQSEVAKLYVATFNRAPDSAGLEYWVSSGMTLPKIAESFFDQPETKNLYPSNTSNRNFIQSVYQNLFNREPDSSGWDYWEDELDRGSFSKNSFILAVINGAQDNDISKDATILENKNSVGLYFAQTGLEDENEAKSILSGITADPITVNNAFINIVNNNNITINNVIYNYNDSCKAEYETIKDGVCSLKTCKDEAYNCPACSSGETLKYYNNGYGYCSSEEQEEILTSDEDIDDLITSLFGDLFDDLNEPLDSEANVETQKTSTVSTGSITHNNIKYDTVTSPYTGRVWLDRNLGASRVCTTIDDKECYGDYYQWGRKSDGHEKFESSTSSTMLDSITNTSSEFIFNDSIHYNLDWTTADSDGSLRSKEWSKSDGSSICPIGFRVPTIDELKEEITEGIKINENNTNGFNSFLKIPNNGFRSSYNGIIDGDGEYNLFFLWSASNNMANNNEASYYATFGEHRSEHLRGEGVRCIKEIKSNSGDSFVDNQDEIDDEEFNLDNLFVDDQDEIDDENINIDDFFTNNQDNVSNNTELTVSSNKLDLSMTDDYGSNTAVSLTRKKIIQYGKVYASIFNDEINFYFSYSGFALNNYAKIRFNIYKKDSSTKIVSSSVYDLSKNGDVISYSPNYDFVTGNYEIEIEIIDRDANIGYKLKTVGTIDVSNTIKHNSDNDNNFETIYKK